MYVLKWKHLKWFISYQEEQEVARRRQQKDTKDNKSNSTTPTKQKEQNKVGHDLHMFSVLLYYVSLYTSECLTARRGSCPLCVNMCVSIRFTATGLLWGGRASQLGDSGQALRQTQESTALVQRSKVEQQQEARPTQESCPGCREEKQEESECAGLAARQDPFCGTLSGSELTHLFTHTHNEISVSFLPNGTIRPVMEI